MASGIRVQETVASTFTASSAAVIESPSIGLNGAVKALSIVVKSIQAENYSTGAFGAPYNKASHNLADGSGETGGNSPDAGGGGAGNRHCAAWEEVNQAFNLVCDMLQCLCSIVGCPDSTAQVRSLATQSKMNRNRGE